MNDEAMCPDCGDAVTEGEDCAYCAWLDHQERRAEQKREELMEANMEGYSR